MAAAVIGAATAYALDAQKKRQEAEAAQIAQVRAEVAAKNAAIEANRIAMMEQLKIRSWLEGQAIFKAQLEYLQDNKASPEEIEKLQQTAATQGFGAAIANAANLGQQLAQQNSSIDQGNGKPLFAPAKDDINPPVGTLVVIGVLLTVAIVVSEIALTWAEIYFAPVVVVNPLIGVPLELILVGTSLALIDLEIAYWSYTYRVMQSPDIKQEFEILPPWGF